MVPLGLHLPIGIDAAGEQVQHQQAARKGRLLDLRCRGMGIHCDVLKRANFSND